jgi:oligo-1,6-glucosidase/alpha-glucosidase
MAEQVPWWRKTTIYQIYPRSYKDSTNDGIGDLQGIISKLDHIKDLGFETIWISPFFTSPLQDWGYDISDYLAVAPEYGQIADLERLIDEVHLRDMRILFDLVLNHTSVKHPWFQASSRSKDDPKRDWYIWKDGQGSRPPNNWRSIVGGSGWHFDAPSKQWYYASFLPFQPDLNYRNPEVMAAMLAVARHWLDFGADGYRLDIFHSLFKDQNFRDNPWSTKLFSRDYLAGFFQEYLNNFNQPETIQFACQLRRLADSYPTPKLLLGEIFADNQTARDYLGQNLEGLNLVFQWNLLNVRPQANYLRDVIQDNEANFSQPYTPVLVYGNHDHKRLLSRIGGDRRKAHLLAVFQFTARGVPVTYFGEEIGMSELYLPKNEWKDPVGKHFSWLPAFIPKLMGISATRDGCRSPMQWSGDENAGFTSPGIEPWLPVNRDYPQVNVSNEINRPDSLLNNYRRLLQVRRKHTALHSGSMEIIPQEDKNSRLLAYYRLYAGENILVLLNFSEKEVPYYNDSACQREIFRFGDINQDQNGGISLGPYTAAILIN